MSKLSKTILGPARLGRFDVSDEDWKAFRKAAAGKGLRPSELLGQLVHDYVTAPEIRLPPR